MSLLKNKMLILTAEKLEKALSNRSRCYHCGKLIGKGVPRLSMITRLIPLYKRSACWRCAKNELNSNIKEVKQELTRLNKLKIDLKILIKDCGKAIICESLMEEKK